MNHVETVLLHNIDKPDTCFVFPTDVAASRWADHLLRLRGGTVAMNRFTAWDIFKQNSIRSKVQDKKSIPSALRKIFVCRLVRENGEQGKTRVFSSLIRKEWAGQAALFTPWLTKLLPQLGAWFKKTTGLQADLILGENAEKFASKFEGDDKDLFILAKRYAQFLDAHGFFEPAWETPPFNDTGTEYFIFFPESLSDYSEYRELLAASEHVKTISIVDAGNLPCAGNSVAEGAGNFVAEYNTFFYTNSRSEITEAALYIRALHENRGISWDSIVVCMPDAENYEPYVLREFTNRNIPFVKRSGKPLTDYPAGQFFRSVIDCTSRDFAFSALTGLILNRNLPWKDTVLIQNLVKFGIKNNCISSWVEEKDGKDQAVNVWEDAFEKPFGWLDPDTRKFFGDLKRRLRALRAASSFAELRRQYFIFRERFFDMTQCTDETNLILSRCIAELMYLTGVEKDYPNVPAPDPFAFLTEYFGEVVYLAQQSSSGVMILPYRTAAPAPFDCHIILGAAQDSLSAVFSRMDFLPRQKREKLGIFDEDASAAFIDLHRFNSLKTAAFFCSEQTFSGYAIAHSRIDAPSKARERYASDETMRERFSEDYFSAEGSLCSSSSKKLHANQKQGFDEWHSRRRTGSAGGKWNADKSLLELVQGQLVKNPDFPGKYSVSASSLEPYFRCSLKWLFERILALENEQIEATLMAENISGMVFHAALNLFFAEVKKSGEPLLPPDYSEQGAVLPDSYRTLLEDCVNVIFNGFPCLQADGKPHCATKFPAQIAAKLPAQMSALTSRLIYAEKKDFYIKLENCLASFLSFFAGCRVTGSETSYQTERDSFFLNGKPDCILEDNGRYIIVDFKLKWMPDRSDCTGEGENGLANFQLPMYINLVEEKEKIKVDTALFFSILDAKPEVIFGVIQDAQTNAAIPKKEEARILRDSERFNRIIDELNQKAAQFADEIRTGDFTVFESDYNECNNCSYHRICRTVYKISQQKYLSGKH